MKNLSNFHQLKSLLKSLPDPLFVINESGVYIDIFGGSDDRYYHDGSGLIGLNIYDIMDKKKADWFHQQVKIALDSNGLHTIEYTLTNLEVDGLEEKNGPMNAIYFEAKLMSLPDLYDGERAVLWEARNITKRHNLELQLRELSEKDALTGLYNRRKLTQELEQEFLLGKCCFSLIMYDIDCLKKINDAYGHDVGDKVICLISKIIKRSIRKNDILCRFGGDEFIILLKETSCVEANSIAQKLEKNLKNTDFNICSCPITPTLSIGIAHAETNDANSDQILKRADDALYKAKNNGRNQIVVA